MRILGFTAYGGRGVLHPMEVPDPVPAPGEVLIRMVAAGINPADVKVRSGERQGKVEVVFPMAVGREAAGEVLAVGADTPGPYAGQLVFGATASGTGAVADLVLLDASATAVIPDGVSPQQATCIPVSIGTALDILDELDLPVGATLLVLGAGGGVGTAATQLARHRGIRVLGVASAGKRAVVEACGGEHVESGEGWTDRVRVVAPQGVSAVIDCVGQPVLRDAAALRTTGAPLVSVAAPALAAELGGGGATRRRTATVFAVAAQLVADGHLDPVISGDHPFGPDGVGALAAVAQVETGHAAGNVVVSAG